MKCPFWTTQLGGQYVECHLEKGHAEHCSWKLGKANKNPPCSRYDFVPVKGSVGLQMCGCSLREGHGGDCDFSTERVVSVSADGKLVLPAPDQPGAPVYSVLHDEPTDHELADEGLASEHGGSYDELRKELWLK